MAGHSSSHATGSPAEALLGQAMRVRSISAAQASGAAQLRKSAPGLSIASGAALLNAAQSDQRAPEPGKRSSGASSGFSRGSEPVTAASAQRFAQQSARSSPMAGRLQAAGSERPGTPATSRAQDSALVAWRRVQSEHESRPDKQGSSRDASIASAGERLAHKLQRGVAPAMKEELASIEQVAEDGGSAGNLRSASGGRSKSHRQSVRDHTASTANKVRRSRSQGSSVRRSRSSSSQGRRGSSTVRPDSPAPAATAHGWHTLHRTSSSGLTDSAVSRLTKSALSGRRLSTGTLLTASDLDASALRSSSRQMSTAAQPVQTIKHRRHTGSAAPELDSLCASVDFETSCTAQDSVAQDSGSKAAPDVHVVATVKPRKLTKCLSAPAAVFAPYDTCKSTLDQPSLSLKTLQQAHDFVDLVADAADWATLLSVCSSTGSEATSATSSPDRSFTGLLRA